MKYRAQNMTGKITFVYGVMGSGKSKVLIEEALSKENPILFSSELDERFGKNKIQSRNGMSISCNTFNKGTSFLDFFSNPDIKGRDIFIDEAQFLSKTQILSLEHLKLKGYSLYFYGIKSDSNRELFEGAQTLIEIADNLFEIHKDCEYCTNKALFHKRVDGKDGGAVSIGGDDKFKSVCLEHYLNSTEELKELDEKNRTWGSDLFL